jgi:hypothetical protein
MRERQSGTTFQVAPAFIRRGLCKKEVGSKTELIICYNYVFSKL